MPGQREAPASRRNSRQERRVRVACFCGSVRVCDISGKKREPNVRARLLGALVKCRGKGLRTRRQLDTVLLPLLSGNAAMWYLSSCTPSAKLLCRSRYALLVRARYLMALLVDVLCNFRFVSEHGHQLAKGWPVD